MTTVVCDTCGKILEFGMDRHVCDERDVPTGGDVQKPRTSVLSTGDVRRLQPIAPLPERKDILVSAVQLDTDSATIQFVLRTDVRGTDAGLVLSKQVTVSRSRYLDEIEELTDNLQTLVLDVLEDHLEAPVWKPDLDGEEDDERGMGW